MADEVMDEHYKIVLGEDYPSRLRNREEGGRFGRGGYDYEDFYAVYLLAILCAEAIDQDQLEGFRIGAGTRAIVDDLRTRAPDGDVYYQLKTSGNVSWKRNFAELEKDFEKQRGAIRLAGRWDQVCLVVSDPDAYTRLLANNEYEFLVEHFPQGRLPDDLLSLEEPHFGRLATAIGILSYPFNDAITTLTTTAALANAWTGSGRSGSALELLEKAHRLSEKIRTHGKSGDSVDDLNSMFVGGFSFANRDGTIFMSINSKDGNGDLKVPLAPDSAEWLLFIDKLESDDLSLVDAIVLMHAFAPSHAIPETIE